MLDCSVTMAWCFADEADAYADSVLATLADGEALVPAIWPLEVANVLAVAKRRSRLQESDTLRFVELLGALPIAVEETGFFRATGVVLSLAREHTISAYDASYLELAMRTGVALASRDDGLRNACHRSGVSLFTDE